MKDLKLFQVVELLGKPRIGADDCKVSIVVNVLNSTNNKPLELNSNQVQLTADIAAIHADNKDKVSIDVFENEYLTKADAAVELGVSRPYINELVDKGKLKKVERLEKVKIPWQAVLDFRNTKQK